MADGKQNFPNWASLSINGVKHEDRLSFEKEVQSDRDQEWRANLRRSMTAPVTWLTDQDTFNKFMSEARAMQENNIALMIAEFEGPILYAALRKRLGDLNDARTTGVFDLGLHRTESFDGTLHVKCHRYYVLKNDEQIPLVDFTITTFMDEIQIQYKSLVGELKL